MPENPLPSFRSIGPLDVDDAALDRINMQLGVPTLTRPARMSKLATPAPDADEKPARVDLEKLTIELPGYLADAMKREALDNRMSVRHVVMLALKASGFTIEPDDLVPDGRRSRSKAR